MKNRILYVGLDAHKNTIDVATATGRSNGKVRFYGKISSSLDALNRLIKKLQDGDKQLRFVLYTKPDHVIIKSIAISTKKALTAM